MQTEIHIDKAGRCVIPKDIRDGWGLAPGEPIIAETTQEGLLLRPRQTARMVQHNGLWVYDAPESAGQAVDIVKLLDDVRNERA